MMDVLFKEMVNWSIKQMAETMKEFKARIRTYEAKKKKEKAEYVREGK